MSTDSHKADCAVVLTGGPHRIPSGFNLLLKKKVKKLIITGVHPKTELRDIFPEDPSMENINLEDVILEKESTTTYGNAKKSLPLVQELGCRDLVLITSGFHMPRAFLTFRAYFPKQIPIRSYSTRGQGKNIHWTRVSMESFKMLLYNLFFFGSDAEF